MKSPKRIDVSSSRLTSIASEVRLRMLLAKLRTICSHTTSSIGSRSWLMILDSMTALSPLFLATGSLPPNIASILAWSKSSPSPSVMLGAAISKSMKSSSLIAE